MSWIILAGLLLILIFGFVVMFGAPYLPVRKEQLTTALDLLDLKKGQTLLELGCGDGRVLLAAAQSGWSAVGYELNPVLVIISRARTWRYRRQVRIIWGNYWLGKWPPADGIFVFLIDRHMKRLDKKVTQYANGKKIKLASYAFKIPGKQPAKNHKGVYLYVY